MKTLVLAAIRCSLLFLVPSIIYGSSAQWDLDPISGDWNTAENWTPNGVPNGPADTATFGLSNTRDVSISEDTEVNGIIFTPAATNPYNITVNAGLTVTVSGVGIINNSGNEFQQLTNFGTIRFSNTATAVGVSIFNEGGGAVNFFNRSTASAIIQNEFGGSTNFFDRSTAGSAYIGTYFGTINFFDRSTAGNSQLYGDTNFFDRSTAGSAYIDTFYGTTNFFDRSTAGNAIIYNSGQVNFFDRSTAGPGIFTGATDNIYAGVSFFDNSNAGSVGIELYDGGFISFSDNSNAGSAILLAEGRGFQGQTPDGCEDCGGGPAYIFFSDSSKGGTA